MLKVKYSTQFKKDMKASSKRHYDLAKMQEVISTLRIPKELPPQNFDHPLSGKYNGYQECHVSPDWLLIYQYQEDRLYLYRTETHSDLFNK